MGKLPPCVLCGESLESLFSQLDEALAQCNNDTCDLCHEPLPDEFWRAIWRRMRPDFGREKRYGDALRKCRFIGQTKSKAWTMEKKLERVGAIAAEALRSRRRG